MTRRRVLDLPLLLLTLILTLTPLAVSGATYSIETVKFTVFQMGTAYLLLTLAARGRTSFGFGGGLDFAVAAYVAVNFLSFFRADLKATGVAQLQVLTYQVLFYLVVRSIQVDAAKFRFISTCWMTAAFAVCVVTAYQVLGEQTVRYGVQWDTRATGPFIQPTFLGAYLAVTLPMVVVRMFRAKDPLGQGLYGCLVAFVIVALGFSLSRGGWLGAGLALGMLAYLDRQSEVVRNAALPLVAGTFAAVWVLLLFRPPTDLDVQRLSPLGSRSNQERIALWKGSVRMVGERPLLGHGPGNFAIYFQLYAPEFLQVILANESQRPGHAHSELFHIVAETGLAGIAAWVVMVGYGCWLLVRAERSSDPEERALAQVHLAMMAALITNAAVGLDQRFPTSAMMLWYILGVAGARSGGVAKPAPEEAAEAPVVRRRPLLFAIAVYLMWLPVRDLRADHVKMLGASFEYAHMPDKAAPYLEEAAALRPWDSESFFLIGRNRMLSSDYKGAEEAYLKARELDPYSPTLLYNLAKVYERTGATAEARKLLWRALEINPQFEFVAEELMRLENKKRAR